MNEDLTQEEFAALLARDAEENSDQMIPLTEDKLSIAKQLVQLSEEESRDFAIYLKIKEKWASVFKRLADS